MKKLLSHAAASLLIFSLAAPLCAFADDDSPVSKQMGIINRNVKKLSRQYSDASQKSSSLELVAGIQKAIEESKTLEPSKAEKAKDKSKYMATYKSDLDKLEKEVAGLKEAISDDKTDVAKAELDKIQEMKNTSHKELGVGGGRRGGPGNRGPHPEAPAPVTTGTAPVPAPTE